MIASFLHRVLPSENPKIAKLNNERNQLKKDWNSLELAHDSLFIEGLISKEDYFIIKRANKKSRINTFREISKKRKIITHEFSFNGRSSMRYVVMDIWYISYVFLLVSCFLAIKDERLKMAGLLKWYEPFGSISFIAVSLFWLYHSIFMVKVDFQFTTYIFYLIIVLVVLSYFI